MHATPQSDIKVSLQWHCKVLGAARRMLGYCTKWKALQVSIFSGWKRQRVTCNRSSKSRAASFFISEAFVAKRLIVLEPNVGIFR